MKINGAWHKKNKMPKNATLAQRIKWHIEHHHNCSCREIPPSIQKEIKESLG